MGMHLTQPIVESCAVFDLIERRCLDGDGLLSKAVEQLPPVCGTSAVETKDELVQVIAQLKFGKAAVMNSQKPAFEQGSGVVDSRHEPGGFFASVFGNPRLMVVT